jgi:hypothetical protein
MFKWLKNRRDIQNLKLRDKLLAHVPTACLCTGKCTFLFSEISTSLIADYCALLISDNNYRIMFDIPFVTVQHKVWLHYAEIFVWVTGCVAIDNLPKFNQVLCFIFSRWFPAKHPHVAELL